MTYILDMSTGTEYPLEAPGCQTADTLEACQPGKDRGRDVELRLALVESTPAGRLQAIPPGIDIAELIRNIEA